MEKIPDVYGLFAGVSTNKKDESIEILYEYEKHYMQMIRDFEPQIEYIKTVVEDLRKERLEFYQQLSIVKKTFEEVGVDEHLQQMWLKDLSQNFERSCEVSESIINNYLTKDLQEFKKKIQQKINNL